MTVWYHLVTISIRRHALRTAGLIALCVALTTTLLFAHAVHAVPNVTKTISFQGRLQTASGAVVADGNYNIQFKIYQDGAGTSANNPGGALKWTESYINNGGTSGVEVKNGFFSVSLGSVNPFGTSVDWNQDTLWLSMNVAGNASACTTFGTAPCAADGEMLPMKRITATPYSVNSGAVGGKTANDLVQLGQGAQTDAGTSSSIFINKTGSGNLVQLQAGGTDAFTLNTAGNIIMGSASNQSISVATAASGAGKSLTVKAGAAASGSTLAGGDLVVQGGAGDGSASSGNVIVKANGTNTTGTLQVQNTTGESIFTVDTTNKTIATGTTKLASGIAGAGTNSLWDAATTPGTVDSGDTGSLELGLKFQATQTGNVTGVKFYKSSANLGTHVGNLWDSSGTNLATVTFSGESASGWQYATFASPVHIQANTTYVVSYFAPQGRFSINSGYFSATAHTAGPLTGLKNGTDGANSIYAYTGSSAFPTNASSSDNYWVDVTFQPDIDQISSSRGLTISSNGAMTVGSTSYALGLQGTSIGIGATNGGNVTVQGGDATISNGDGGNIQIDAGAKNGSGSNGSVAIGTTNASSVTIGRTSANASITINGTTVVKQVTDTTNSFSVTTSTNNKVLTVDALNARVAIGSVGTSTPTLAGAGLQIQGALRLDGGADVAVTDLFTTPTGSNVRTKINIPLYDPGSYGQIVAMGIPSTASSTARVISLFDARTTAHQPTIGVFSPDETNLVGFSWDGSNSTASVKNTGNTIALQGNGTNLLTATNNSGSANVGIGNNASGGYALDVTGDVNTSTKYRINGTTTLDNASLTFSGSSSNSSVTSASGKSLNLDGKAGLNVLTNGVTRASFSDTALRIGTGTGSSDPLLLTLDRAAAAATVTDSNAILGSMYYDTTLGKVQCYEAAGWGTCGASPDIFVTLSPEYANAVTHGTGTGTLSSDLCSDTLNINNGTSSQPTICGTNETYNFYKWTSSQGTAQTKDIYVTYQLPATFKKFVASSTSLTGRTDSTNSSVAYQIYRNRSSGLTACGSSVSVSTGSQSTWQNVIATGSADPSACSFAAGDSIVFKITLSSLSNANAYVSNLNFIVSNH